MDIIYEGKEPELNMPYFGKQARYFEFFRDCITPFLPPNGVYAETNSGSISNAFEFAKLGYRVIVNDISEYSDAIANAVFNNARMIVGNTVCKYKWLEEYSSNYLDRASIFAGNISINGYNAPIPTVSNRMLLERAKAYKEQLSIIRAKGIKAYMIFNEELFDYMQLLINIGQVVDVLFMDFAWPWRNGSETDEYNTTANILSGVFNGKNVNIRMWSKRDVIGNVIRAVKMAQKIAKYIFLSDQSSNYPTPELLEVSLLSHGIYYEARHTMLTKATIEDNLLTSSFFREYLYVIKGRCS